MTTSDDKVTFVPRTAEELKEVQSTLALVGLVCEQEGHIETAEGIMRTIQALDYAQGIPGPFDAIAESAKKIRIKMLDAAQGVVDVQPGEAV